MTRGAGAVKGALLSQHFVNEMLARRFANRLGEASVGRGQRAAGRWWRTARASLGPASGVRAIRDVGAPFFALLGYRLRTVTVRDDGVVVCEGEGRDGVVVDVVVAPWSMPLDRVWRIAVKTAVGSGRRWVFAFNGWAMRVVDADRPYAQRYVEFELETILTSERWFPILWGLVRSAAFASDAKRVSLFTEVVRSSEAHGTGVRVGLQTGVRVALSRLSLALARAARRQAGRRGGDEEPAEIVSQALTLIYRLLFLLFAEARGLVPIWHPIYRRSYSLAMLQRQVEMQRADGSGATSGLWDAVQAISRLAHAGCRTDEFTMTAFNGRLFSPSATPLGERVQISSAVMAVVLRALMQTRSGPGRRCERITYGDLGVEELGAIYERVLDHVPVVEALTASVGRGRGAQQGPVGVVARARRKESGTFYTPRSMADYLVRQTLSPLVEQASPEEILSLRVVDPAMGSGAFLVCACRYLAWAYERALDRANRPLPSSDAQRAEIRRWVARQCLFGVDVNPVAVQLARLSLWLTTLTMDAPLTFLDHHLRVGDSLIGASLDDLSRRPPAQAGGRGARRRRTDDSFPLFLQDEVVGPMRALLDVREQLVVADDSPAIVRRKERLMDEAGREGVVAGWRRLADVWCASWFAEFAAGEGPPPRAWAAVCDYVREGRAALPVAQLERWVEAAGAIARERRFFHWTLEFPEAFFDRQGAVAENAGFDAVVGNPPWNVLRGAMGRFVRESGLYDPLPDAHPNLYQLFVSRSIALLKRGGRLGLVVPWGLACDHGSARLRRLLLERCALDTVVSFDNAARVFPIHPGLRFMLFTCTSGRETMRVRCRLGQRDPGVLDRLEDGRQAAGRADMVVTIGLLKRVSGESYSIPDVREEIELALLDRLHGEWPALGSRDGWGVAFGRELNATDDRGLMAEASAEAEAAGERMPVLEGKHLQPFRVQAHRAQFVILPGAEAAVRARVPGVARPRLAYREVTFPGTRLALVAAMLPAGAVSTHTVFCLKSALVIQAQWCLCALLNSLVCNYLVRVRAGSHVTAALLHRLPVPRPLSDSTMGRELARLARRLSGGRKVKREEEDEAATPIVNGRAARSRYARLQALAARVYGVREAELVYLLTTFATAIDDALRGEIVDGYRALAGAGRW